MSKISIKIPVYNVAKYLPACLDSILAQTYQDYEAICINDDSPDNCLDILNEYAKKDARIKVINQKNQGVSAARNNGLSKASGEYIAFLDSDDLLHPQYLEKLHSAIQLSNADFVWCDYIKFFDGDNLDISLKNDCNFSVVAKPWKYFIENKKPAVGIVIWNKLYKKNLLADLRFDEDMPISEDVLYIYKATYNAKKMAHIPEKLMYYRQRHGSAVNSAPSHKFANSNVLFSQRLISYFDKLEMPFSYSHKVKRKACKHMLRYVIKYPFVNGLPDYKNTWQEQRSTFVDLQKKGLDIYKYQNFKNKIILFLFMRGKYKSLEILLKYSIFSK